MPATSMEMASETAVTDKDKLLALAPIPKSAAKTGMSGWTQ
jgi:hypothetical protein